MKSVRVFAIGTTALFSLPAFAADDAEVGREILVTGAREASQSATKTDTPAIETPQPVTVIDDELYLAQGAVSISDTLRYVAGVTANPYGPDSREDGALVRGITAVQFRDGMRDIFSYFSTIRADPYNFDQVELVRGPASVLFGQGSLGGIVNLVSKKPRFETGGEISVRYGSFDRKEVLADLTGAITGDLAGRVVARIRDSDTQTDHVPDDRVLVSPSLTYTPGPDTRVTFIGLYQEDDGGSTSQFLPLVGTIYENPNGRLPNDLFIGKPGWDRYDGRLLQGTALFEHRFGDSLRLNLKARYSDSDLTYLTHYPDSYRNPANPHVIPGAFDPDTDEPIPDPEQRTIGLYADGSRARMEIFSTDNNLQFDFDTGEGIEHVLLAGVDFSRSRVRKLAGYGYEYIDIYDIDYDALSDYDGGLPPGASVSEDVTTRQLGFYLQDQIRLFDRVSTVFGVRRDEVDVRSLDLESMTYGDEDYGATSFRAGIIGEVVRGVSPFFSYTESFEPISGTASNGRAFVPKRGRQFEAGVKFHPDEATMVTVTGYHIKETNRPVDDPGTPDPFDQMQVGSLTSKGIEFEASTTLPGELQILASYSYNEAEVDGTNRQIDDVPKTNASIWMTKALDMGQDMSLLLGGGARYVGKHRSFGPAFPDGVVTPGYTLADAYAELTWNNWSLAINATNLFDKRFYSSCLSRGDCFMGEERNVFGTVSYRF